MNRNIPKHFSNRFMLNIEELPAKESDRLNLYILLPGLIFGMALFGLGFIDFFQGGNSTQPLFENLISGNDDYYLIDSALLDKLMSENTDYHYLIDPNLFDIILMIIGMWITISLFLSHMRYKKIFFDGKNITMVKRSARGKKITFRENINNYEGVMLRIEFFQCGMFTRNKYIIELYHKNFKKIVPLYINTSDKNIRKIWENYARVLNLPTLMYTDEGMVKREVSDLDKSLKEMCAIWDLKKKFKENSKPSSHIGVKHKKDKIIIKTQKVVWDAYSLLVWLLIIMALAIGVIVTLGKENFSASALTTFYLIEISGVLTALFWLFRKEKLVLKKDKIVNTYKYMGFSVKHDEISNDKIESVEVNFNPATNRYFVAIISDDKTIVFGKKLPIEDLKWIKKFIINEIVKD